MALEILLARSKRTSIAMAVGNQLRDESTGIHNRSPLMGQLPPETACIARKFFTNSPIAMMVRLRPVWMREASRYTGTDSWHAFFPRYL
jgi:hypothetical protein